MNLTPQQVSALIAAAETPRDKALMAVCYQCGLRRSDVSRLQRYHYLPETRTLFVPRKKLSMPTQNELWERTAWHLDKYLVSRKDSHPALFLSRKGRPMSGQNVYYVYRDLAALIGLPEDLRHPHCLRHAISVHLTSAGLDIMSLQAYLGHLEPEGTIHYVKGAIKPMPNQVTTAQSTSKVANF